MKEFISNYNKDLRVLPLQLYDVLEVLPGVETEKWKLGQNVSSQYIRDIWWDKSSFKMEIPIGLELKVIAINYHKYKWWQFWKKKSKVDSYLLEVVKLP